MMKKPITLLLLSLIVLYACNNGGKDKAADRENGYSKTPGNKVDSLLEDIGQAHEFGMSQNHKLIGLQKDLSHYLDSMNTVTAPLSEHVKAYTQSMISAREDLSKADSAMNEWMDKFNPDSLQNDMDLRVKYLESEKAKMEKVKVLLFTSINHADSLFHHPSLK